MNPFRKKKVRHITKKADLQFDTLERRTVLSTCTPNVFVDSPTATNGSYCSLREAVEQSNQSPGPDTIRLTAGRYELNVFGKYVGEYENNRFSADGKPKPLGDYTDVNLVAAVRLGDAGATRLYAKVENIFDDEYSSVVGYYDPGRRVRAGIQHEW